MINPMMPGGGGMPPPPGGGGPLMPPGGAGGPQPGGPGGPGPGAGPGGPGGPQLPGGMLSQMLQQHMQQQQAQQKPIGLCANPPNVAFQCGTCQFFQQSRCTFPDPRLNGKPVQPVWCCDNYRHPQMQELIK